MHHFSSISNRFLTLNSTFFGHTCYGTQTFITIVTKSHEAIPYISHFKAYLFRLSFKIIITSTCRLRCILPPWSFNTLLVTRFELTNGVSDVFVLYETDTVEVIICLRRQHCQLQSHPTRMWSNNRHTSTNIKLNLANIDNLEIYDETTQILNPQITTPGVKIKLTHKTCITPKGYTSSIPNNHDTWNFMKFLAILVNIVTAMFLFRTFFIYNVLSTSHILLHSQIECT